MKKISILSTLVIVALSTIALFILGPGVVERGMNKVHGVELNAITTTAETLHKKLFIADLHADSLLWSRDLLQRGERGHVDFPRLQQGNVALQMFTTVTKTPAGLNYNSNNTDSRDNVTLLALVQRWPLATWSDLTQRALYQSARLHQMAAQAKDTVTIIKTQQDLQDLLKRRSTGRAVVGAMLGTEGSHALGGDIKNIQVLFDAGFRMMSLQHFFDNALGGSLHGTSKDGLTDFGRRAVIEMNRLGVMIDVSHSSPQVVSDVLALSQQPLIVSHTGIYSHCPSARNIPDPLMRQIAQAGGLIGIGFWQGAVCDDSPAGIAGAIQAAVQLLGEDAVALGSDYDGAVTTRFDVSQLAQLTQALLDVGMAETTIAKVMGGNQLRFFQNHLPRGQ